jgi:EAL domain-containing protein (putative c-di-GMP-specific phosphodiesterase class I)
VQRLEGSAANPSTLRAIAALAQQLGLKTVAEGVETERHVAELGEIGCDLMQGFFLARPLKPRAAGSLLRKQQTSSKVFEEVAAVARFAEHNAAEYAAMQK